MNHVWFQGIPQFEEGIPSTLALWGGVTVSFKTNMQESRNPNGVLILVSFYLGYWKEQKRRVSLLMGIWRQLVIVQFVYLSCSLFTANNLDSINEDAFLGLPHLEYLWVNEAKLKLDFERPGSLFPLSYITLMLFPDSSRTTKSSRYHHMLFVDSKP